MRQLLAMIREFLKNVFVGDLGPGNRPRPEPREEPQEDLSDQGATEMSDEGVRFVKAHEGLSLKAYWDYHGYSIGYGHLGAKKDDVITKEQAEVLLKEDMRWTTKAVLRAVKVPLTQNELDALISWTFNLGEGNLRSSTMLKRLNAGNKKAVPAEMKKWIYAGGAIHPGLVRRRADEAELFSRGSAFRKGIL